ncbi:hypothetical protein OS493_034332 [Desmophyllum pertusum]|uniref:Uncharacterized protein n=1 Tax=Desmophyllum pertusum TaxID=174260 RepID=A0A9W9YLZ9_9CNID|nr:hypothetical protein OS493_034332 [Desmophyllum pertusum]
MAFFVATLHYKNVPQLSLSLLLNKPALHAESSQEQTRTLVEKDSSNDDRTDSDVSSNGPDGLATELSRLAISVPSPADDETFLSPDTGSIVSSTSEEAQAAKARSVVPREKLNEYLVSDGIAPITQPWLEWEKASDRTKQRYTSRTVEIVSSVLHTISPNDAGSLWQAIVSSDAMNKALGARRIIADVKGLSRGSGGGLRQCE